MMGTMARTLSRSIAIMSLGLLWGLAYGQASETYEPDPPERAARLSHIEGDVSLQPVGEEEWAPALINRPLTTGDKLWTERGARAEITVGPADVRLDSDTGFSFLNVDSDVIQMRLTAGVINVSVRSLDGNEQIEVATPNVAVLLLRSGNYRIEVNDAGDSTVVKVGEGAAEVTGPSQNVVVHSRQMVTIRGADNLVAQFSTPGPPDEFDSWNQDRDLLDERAASSRTAQYVSPDVTGYEDLEDNGTWSSEPEYGYVWTPRNVAVDWAPYRYGRWVWISPWGYTWIDDMRWGYAPFHYGRWAHIRHRWCWVPGPRHVRAVYAPALVGWHGSRGGHVSWYPLGPRDVYAPGRHFSRHYWERVNGSSSVAVPRSHVREVYDRRGGNRPYKNPSVPVGATAVSRDAFASAGRTRDHRVRIREQELAREMVDAEAPRIAAGRESRLGGEPRHQVRTPPRNVVDRQVVVRRAPPASVARFARTPVSRDVAQVPERVAGPPLRGQERGTRQDRPPRVDRPVSQTAPPAQSSVHDRNAIAERVREDRDRQVREAQQREALQRREATMPQRWEPRESRETQREANERPQRQVDGMREALQRQAEQRERSVQRERNVDRAREQPRMQQPRVEQPRVEQPRVQQPRVEQPRVEQPRAQQPRVEQPGRVPNPTESRSQPERRQHNDPRARKD
jgi:hypothetical protein